MNKLVVSVALLFSSSCLAMNVSDLESSIARDQSEKTSCELRVKELHKQIAELNEKIARTESALVVRKSEAQRVAAAPVAQAPVTTAA